MQFLQLGVHIVSFLPSATETLYQLGAASQIVGVTHECNFPSGARKKPRVIRPSFDPGRMTGQEIDSKIVELMRSGKDIYIVDDAALKKAKPDLIVAQGLCEVCSPFTKEISRAVNILGGRPDVLVLDPHDLDDILVSIMDMAEKVDRVVAGRKLVTSLQHDGLGHFGAGRVTVRTAPAGTGAQAQGALHRVARPAVYCRPLGSPDGRVRRRHKWHQCCRRAVAPDGHRRSCSV